MRVELKLAVDGDMASENQRQLLPSLILPLTPCEQQDLPPLIGLLPFFLVPYLPLAQLSAPADPFALHQSEPSV
jgi:hypothetical protein